MMRGRFGWNRNSRPEHNPVLISDPTRGGNCDIGRGQTFLEARGSHGIYHGQNAGCEGRSYNCRSRPDAGHFTFFLVIFFLLPFLFFLSFFYFLRDFWQSFWYFLVCFWFLWERCLDIIWEIYSSASPSWEISNNLWETSSFFCSFSLRDFWRYLRDFFFCSCSLRDFGQSWKDFSFFFCLLRERDFFLLIDFWQSGLEEEGQVSCKYYVDVCIGGWDVLDSEERGQISHRRLCSWVLWPCKRGRC